MKKTIDLWEVTCFSIKLDLKMKLSLLFVFLSFLNLLANDSYSQTTRLSLHMENVPLNEVIAEIEDRSDFKFLYNRNDVNLDRLVSVNVKNKKISTILARLLFNTNLDYEVVNKQIILKGKKLSQKKAQPTKENTYQGFTVTGTVTDQQGVPLGGANIIEKGTTNGTQTDFDGNFTIQVVNEAAILVFSYIGFVNQEVTVGNQSTINIILKESAAALDEVVVVGYGTQKKSDLTGSVIRADIESFKDQPNVSIVQSLQGTVPGLNIGQVESAGENPSISVRGRTSISGAQNPLIVLDGTIYRGDLIDINPNDVASIDVLKDASAAAVYGSQAANGVIIITSKSGKRSEKLSFSFNTSYSVQSPIKEFRPGTTEDWLNQYINGDIFESRLAPDYLTVNPDYDPTSLFKTEDMVQAFNEGKSTNWFDILTNDAPFVAKHNLSVSYGNEKVSSFVSIGYTEQEGYHIGEDFNRWNARLNLDNYINDWLTIGIQTFFTHSDFSGLDIDRSLRYLSPYALAYNDDGTLRRQPGGLDTNPLFDVLESDHEDFRINLFANVYANIDIPFIKGLSYKINYTTNYRNEIENIYKPHGSNFQGLASKESIIRRSYSSDNILSYRNTFAEHHNVGATLLYGFEKRKLSGTYSQASNFVDGSLGFNRLEAGQSDLQQVNSDAEEESSLYSMGRLTYNYDGKYFFTGTVRRDGFSGFGENNKFGVFPSASVAWVPTAEKFLENVSWLANLKLRGSYGVSGNRTLERYQTLPRIESGYTYVDADGNPLYSQSINTLGNNNLKWETTTGYNLGIDFGLFQSRVSGSIDYYANKTEDLLYKVNLPQTSGFQEVAVNLGELQNHGLDITLSSVNIDSKDFKWTSAFTFSRVRDKLVSLLGADNDGDGIEDDIVANSLFIGEPLETIFDYQVTGELWQLGDDIPSGFGVGTNRIQDIDGVEGISPNDRTILGYVVPDYRFSIQNQFEYKNWSLNVFINSIQGGGNRYLGTDNLWSWNPPNEVNLFDNGYNLPSGVDYWTPENPNARYQKIGNTTSFPASRYVSRSFVRLQDVSLGYRFEEGLLEKLNLSSLRIYFSGKNLCTWTDYTGWDPETGTGISMDGRPVMKSYTLGLNFEF